MTTMSISTNSAHPLWFAGSEKPKKILDLASSPKRRTLASPLSVQMQPLSDLDGERFAIGTPLSKPSKKPALGTNPKNDHQVGWLQ